MSASVSWFIYCDDCAEMVSDCDQGFSSATAARKSGAKRGACRRKMRDGKMYDLCADCIDDRNLHEDDSVPTEARRR